MEILHLSPQLNVDDVHNFLLREEIGYLFLTSIGCKACDEMKEAVGATESDLSFPNIYGWQIGDEPRKIMELSDLYGISGFPALILFADNEVQRRWIGFFPDGSFHEKCGRLKNILEQSLNAWRAGAGHGVVAQN